MTEEWNGLSVLQLAASRVGALDLGFLPGQGRPLPRWRRAASMLFNLGADEIEIAPKS